MNFEDSRFDLRQIAETLCHIEALLRSGLPKIRPYDPGQSGDLDGIGSAYNSLSETVSGVWSGTLEAVEKYIQTGKWGRLKTETAFWLKESLQAAVLYFRVAQKTPPCAASRSALPEKAKSFLDKTDQAVLAWLLTKRWREHLAPLWMKNNAPLYVYTEQWNCCRHSEAEEEKFRRALCDIPDRHFVWSPSGSYYQNHTGDFPYNYL